MRKNFRFLSTFVALIALSAVALGPTSAQASQSKRKRSRSSDTLSSSSSAERHSRSKINDWDMLFGGVQAGHASLSLQLAYPTLPRATFEYGVSDSFGIGFATELALNYYAPSSGVAPFLLFNVPMRISLAKTDGVSAGLFLTPGFVYSTANSAPGFSLDAGANVGGTIADMMILGGGMEIPFALVIPNGVVVTVIPILFGPVYELHPIHNLAVSLDAKFGPGIQTVFNFGTSLYFSMKIMAGVAYHF